VSLLDLWHKLLAAKAVSLLDLWHKLLAAPCVVLSSKR